MVSGLEGAIEVASRQAFSDQSEKMKRQRASADFGDFVLDYGDLDEILTEGCR